MNDIKIYKFKNRNLPTVLTNSQEFISLDKKKKSNFISRIKYIEEITLKINDWVEISDEIFCDLFNSIELDVYINLGAPCSESDNVLSQWIVHTSWIFDTSTSAMCAVIDGSIFEEIDRPQPTVKSDIYEFKLWLTMQNRALISSVDNFYSASDFDTAIAYQIVIDIFLANFLTGLLRARLNSKFSI